MTGEVGGDSINPRVGLLIPRSIVCVRLPRGWVSCLADCAFPPVDRKRHRRVGWWIVDLVYGVVVLGEVLDRLDRVLG